MHVENGCLTPCSERRMVKKFQETGSFTLKYGWGGELIPFFMQAEIATAIVELSGVPEAGANLLRVGSRVGYSMFKKSWKK